MAPGEDDPVARAEKALAELSTEFGIWMHAECERLDSARRALASGGFTAANKDALFHAAHDLKGEAATFGYPAVAAPPTACAASSSTRPIRPAFR